MLLATEQQYKAIQYSCLSLIGDANFMMKALKVDYRAVEFALNNLERLFKEHKAP